MAWPRVRMTPSEIPIEVVFTPRPDSFRECHSGSVSKRNSWGRVVTHLEPQGRSTNSSRSSLTYVEGPTLGS